MSWEPCITCARLTRCDLVDAELLLDGGGCSLHAQVHEGVFRARLRIMDEFGAYAIPTKKNLKEGVVQIMPDINVSKKNLRALGKLLGTVPAGGASFKLSEAELVEKILESGDPRVKGIAKMSDEDVVALIAAIEGGDEAPADEPAPAPAPAPAAAPKRPAGRTAAPAPAPAPAEEEEEAPAEETRRGVPPRRPAAPVGRKEPVRDEGAVVASANAELQKIQKMVEVIGVNGDARDAAILALSKKVDKLAEAVEVISAHLTFLYNAGVGPKDQISSLNEVDWLAP